MTTRDASQLTSTDRDIIHQAREVGPALDRARRQGYFDPGYAWLVDIAEGYLLTPQLHGSGGQSDG